MSPAEKQRQLQLRMKMEEEEEAESAKTNPKTGLPTKLIGANVSPDEVGVEPAPDDNPLAFMRPDTKTGALIHGAEKGLTLNHSDEIQGLLNALGSIGTDESMSDAYSRGKQDLLASEAMAQQEHPELFKTGEIGGNIATAAALPGPKGTLLQKLPTLLGQGALLGGTAAEGSSDAPLFSKETLLRTGAGTGIGALTNMAGGALMHGAGKLVGKLFPPAPSTSPVPAPQAPVPSAPVDIQPGTPQTEDQMIRLLQASLARAKGTPAPAPVPVAPAGPPSPTVGQAFGSFVKGVSSPIDSTMGAAGKALESGASLGDAIGEGLKPFTEMGRALGKFEKMQSLISGIGDAAEKSKLAGIVQMVSQDANPEVLDYLWKEMSPAYNLLSLAAEKVDGK